MCLEGHIPTRAPTEVVFIEDVRVLGRPGRCTKFISDGVDHVDSGTHFPPDHFLHRTYFPQEAIRTGWLALREAIDHGVSHFTRILPSFEFRCRFPAAHCGSQCVLQSSLCRGPIVVGVGRDQHARYLWFEVDFTDGSVFEVRPNLCHHAREVVRGALGCPSPSRRSYHCFSPWEGPQVCSLSAPVLRGGSRRFSGPFPSPSRSPVLRLSGCDFQGPHSRFLVVIPDALVTDVEVLRQRPV